MSVRAQRIAEIWDMNCVPIRISDVHYKPGGVRQAHPSFAQEGGLLTDQRSFTQAGEPRVPSNMQIVLCPNQRVDVSIKHQGCNFWLRLLPSAHPENFNMEIESADAGSSFLLYRIRVSVL